MPAKQAHQNKQNWTQLALIDLQQSQNSPQHADWIVTLAFYKVLHAVDSYLAQKQIHPRGHTASQGRMGRNQYVKRYLRIIYPQYNALYRASRKARYNAYTYQADPQEVTKLVNQASDIEKYIKTLL